MSSAGQGSISLSQKAPVIPAPGPPFAPTSADNGLSVDPVTGRIVLGNDLGGTGAELLSDREIEMQNFILQLLSNGGLQFLVDPLSGSYVLGDFGALGGGTFLNINDPSGSAEISGNILGAPASQMLALSGNLSRFAMGDITGANNGMRMTLDDAASITRIENTAELMLFFGPSVYSMGNVNGTLNGSFTSIDDINESFVFRSTAKGRRLVLLGSLETSQMGDVDATGNGLVINLDDIGSRATIGTTAGAMLDLVQAGIYEFGDVDGAFNQTKVSLDDANQFAQINGGGAMLSLNKSTGLYEIGDIQPDNNGARLLIDDNTGIFDIDNTASTASVNINGVAGFTGTVANPVTITVDGGIVTNVA